MRLTADADAIVISMLLPITGPAGHVAPDANLLRRGLLRVVREGASSRQRGEAASEAMHGDPGQVGNAWTVSAPFERGGRVWFRVTALGMGQALWIGTALRPGAALVPSLFKIGEKEMWGVRTATLDDLAERGSVGAIERATVSFSSPTTFRSPDGRGHDPLPTLVRLLSGWRRRWIGYVGNDHEMAVARMIADERLIAWASDSVRLEHQDLSYGEHTPPGGRGGALRAVSGTLHLVIEDEPSIERDAFRALLRFAAFAGTGRHLGVGMGQTLTQVATAPVAITDPLGLMLASHKFG